MIEKLTGIWSSDYVCRMGVMSHLRELQTIDDEINRLKNRELDDHDHEPTIRALETHFLWECADLHLILSNLVDPLLLGERRRKFDSKAKEEADSKDFRESAVLDIKKFMGRVEEERRKEERRKEHPKRISPNDLMNKLNRKSEEGYVPFENLGELLAKYPSAADVIELPDEVIETIRKYNR